MTRPQPTAQSVSALLRRNGLLVTPRSREGIHVSGTGADLRVSVDVETRTLHGALVDHATDVLLRHGYTLRIAKNPGITSLYVTRD